MMGTFDLGYYVYAQNILQGEVQKAGRDATLQNGGINAPSLDARVQEQGSRVVKNGTWTFERKFFESFTKAGRLEDFTDEAPFDGVFDPEEECFADENANGTRDDGGRSGQGGADDIVNYTVSVSYPRVFPMYGLLGWSQNATISANTVLRNQPFGEQQAGTSPVAVCPQ